MPAAVLRAQGEPGGQREALQGEKSRDGGRDGRKRFWRGEQPLRAEVGYGGEQLPGGGPPIAGGGSEWMGLWGCAGRAAQLPLLLLHLHTQRLLKRLRNCVRGVPACLPSSNSILSLGFLSFFFFFTALLPLHNGHLAIDFSAVHLLGVFCPPTGAVPPQVSQSVSQLGSSQAFIASSHLLSPPITPTHGFDNVLYRLHLQLLAEPPCTLPAPPGVYWLGGGCFAVVKPDVTHCYSRAGGVQWCCAMGRAMG